MSSIKPDDAGGHVDRREKVSRSLVVSRGDGPKLLQPREEVLDQVPFRIQVPVEFPGPLAIGFRWYHGLLPRGGERPDDPFIGVERLVGDQHIGLHDRDEFIGPREIVNLAPGQMEANRITQCISHRMDFGAQSPARAPDRLVLAGFFLAPALC